MDFLLYLLKIERDTMLRKYIFLLFSLILFVGCSSKNIYNMALKYERNNANLEKKFQTLSFGKIAYLENTTREKETIVLLHGFGANKDNWDRFVSAIKGQYHIIIPDLAGHGESTLNMDLNYTLSHHVRRLKIFLQSKNITSFHIVGNSMGGGIALLYSHLHQEEIKTLTLIDSIGIMKTKSDIMHHIEETGNNPFLDVCNHEKFDILLEYGMYKKPYIPDFIKTLLIEEKCKNALLEKKMYVDLIKNINLINTAKQITIPTLIIWGEKDKILHVNNAKSFHQEIKNSKLKIFKESGHVPMFEIPIKTARTFENFITSLKE